nr:putative ribonuclease H-like domain-containing protein [Tanacetum cinerariifolium]
MEIETKMPNSRPSFPYHKCINDPKKGNPQHALKDMGVINSGCSRHMTWNMSYLSNFEELNGGYVTFGGNPKGGKITGKGKTKTCKLDFDDVYFVKELKFNLFSVSQMCDKKNSVLFTDTECLILSPDFKLLDESQVLLRVLMENNMYNVNLKNIVLSGDLTCLFAKATIDKSNLWHRRLAHINFKTINKLVKGNFVRGLPIKVFENDLTCVACTKGKQHRASCKTKPVSFVDQPLYMLHMDLFETTFVKSLNKKSYCLGVIDDYDLDTFSSVRRPKNSVVIWKKKGSSNTSNVDLSVVNLSKLNKNVKRYSQKRLVGIISPVSKMPFRKKPRDSMHVRSKSNMIKSLPGTVHKRLPKLQPLAEIVAKWFPRIVQICLWVINLGCSKHMTGNRALLTNFVEKFLRTVRFGNNDFPVIAGYGDVGLEVAFRKSTCFVRNEDGVDLLTVGYSQQEGIDYDETFPHVARIKAIRLFLAYVAHKDFTVFQMDVMTTFHNGILNKEVYVSQPPGFVSKQYPDHVYALDKALYGLKQAPRAWYDVLSQFF